MMRISVIIGALHIATANLLMARQHWGQALANAKIGWVLATTGGLFIWFGATNISPASLYTSTGPWLLGAGLCLVFFYNGAAADVDPRNSFIGICLHRLWAGLKGLTDISGLFGDILSYLRLFALGLASASLALTFNQLAQQVQQAMPGVGLLLSLLILVLGHSLNLALAIMSGVVHGLRLNFIEFYKWGLTEEGYAFRAFARHVISKKHR